MRNSPPRRSVDTTSWGRHGFTDRSERIYAYGKTAASDAFLKGKWQVILQPPANPNATPNPVIPTPIKRSVRVVFITQNYLQSGSGLILDLNANVAPGSNPMLSRPAEPGPTT